MIKFKQTLWLWLACMCIGISSFNVQAQQNTLKLSLDEAKTYALQNNRTLQKGNISIDLTEKSIWEQISAGLPQVKLSSNYQNYMGYKFDIFGMSYPLTSSFNAQLQVSQLLFSGNYFVGVQIAKIAKQISVSNQKKSELDVIQQVSQSYYNVLVTQEMKKIITENLVNLHQLLKNTEAMAMAGVTERTNVDQLNVEVFSMENSMKTSERQLELAYNMLRLQLGVNANVELVLTDSLNSFVRDEAISSLMLEPFVADNSYDMVLMNQNIQLTKKEVNLAATNFLPTVSCYYSYTDKFKQSSFDTQPPNTFGITASLPLFTGGGNYSKVKQAKLKLKSAELDKDNLKDQLSVQEKQLRFNLRNAYENYLNQKKNIDVSNRVFGNITKKYQQGVSSGLDLTNGNNNLLLAQSNYISSLLQLLNAEAELNNLLGKK
ncbi:MAG: TolC family protein [Paludibacteraceae bacterium]|nr:TolC family protein [Paludibacteraceae bacterium]